MSSNKKRKYDTSYIQYGFQCLITNGEEKPQCVLCMKVLSNDSLRPNKLKQHLSSVHPQHTEKDRDFFERHGKQLKQMRLDTTGTFHETNSKLLEASYKVAYEIANQKKPHTIGEDLIKPCTLMMAELILGKEAEKKLAAVPLSNSTVQRRISTMARDIQDQVIQQIKSSSFGLYAIQLDESTDVASCAQLMVYARYVHKEEIKEEFLFCAPLQVTTKAKDIFDVVTNFFDEVDLKWENVIGCCTDGAPAMLGTRSGFQALVKKVSPNVKSTHCMLHRHALAVKTLPSSLSIVLQEIIELVNYIKSSALQTRLFKELCKDMDAGHQTLLYHTNVRWLSRGNVTARVFSLRDELISFTELQGKESFHKQLTDNNWILQVAYLVDIFEQFNQLNLKMQGPNTDMVRFLNQLNAFQAKLINWKRKASCGNFAMFESLDNLLDSSDLGLSAEIQNEITEHLEHLHTEFKRYFPEISNEDLDLLINPFQCEVSMVPDECQDQFLELKFDSAAKISFEKMSVNEFWPTMSASYPKVAKVALRKLIPFVTTYLCESGFSALLAIKSKARNRLMVEDDLRCALSKTKPRIELLCQNEQQQKSH
ncbi:Uncharacterised protein r2_g4062 [Pycnogonum litorale]